MRSDRIYLDHNASSPVRPEVADAWRDALAFGNPSSVHAEGRRARAAVETARGRVARLVGAEPDWVVFTSGGTEANGTALRPGAMRSADGRPVERLLVGATEHPSALRGHRFPTGCTEVIGVDRHGLVDLNALQAALANSDAPTLVSVQVANGETGIVQPVDAIASLARKAGAAFHADAVQAAGRMPFDMRVSGIDALTLSAHKLGGPTGAGSLVARPECVGPDFALLAGGTQERGARAGTEAVPAIVGFGIAAESATRELASEPDRLRALRDRLERAVIDLLPHAVVFGQDVERLPNTVAFAADDLRADTLLIALDLAGVAVSSGSACSSGTVGRSAVLAAMGVSPEFVAGAIRVSLGWSSCDNDVSGFRDAFASVLQRIYERRRARAA